MLHAGCVCVCVCQKSQDDSHKHVIEVSLFYLRHDTRNCQGKIVLEIFWEKLNGYFSGKRHEDFIKVHIVNNWKHHKNVGKFSQESINPSKCMFRNDFRFQNGWNFRTGWEKKNLIQIWKPRPVIFIYLFNFYASHLSGRLTSYNSPM